MTLPVRNDDKSPDTRSLDRARRKDLTHAYKLSFPPMGIFSVKNNVTGRQWIGQSANLTSALNRHRLELRLGTHRNPALMADWRAFGEAEFSFEIVEQLKERPEPDFDYACELDRCMAMWRMKIPAGSTTSYL